MWGTHAGTWADEHEGHLVPWTSSEHRLLPSFVGVSVQGPRRDHWGPGHNPRPLRAGMTGLVPLLGLPSKFRSLPDCGGW